MIHVLSTTTADILLMVLMAILIVFFAVFVTKKYNPKSVEPPPSHEALHSWEGFIKSNIEKSINEDQLTCCYSMIDLFIIRFNREYPAHILESMAMSLKSTLMLRHKIINHSKKIKK